MDSIPQAKTTRAVLAFNAVSYNEIQSIRPRRLQRLVFFDLPAGNWLTCYPWFAKECAYLLYRHNAWIATDFDSVGSVVYCDLFDVFHLTESCFCLPR